jgi:hypothetical protein
LQIGNNLEEKVGKVGSIHGVLERWFLHGQPNETAITGVILAQQVMMGNLTVQTNFQFL